MVTRNIILSLRSFLLLSVVTILFTNYSIACDTTYIHKDCSLETYGQDGFDGFRHLVNTNVTKNDQETLPMFALMPKPKNDEPLSFVFDWCKIWDHGGMGKWNYNQNTNVSLQFNYSKVSALTFNEISGWLKFYKSNIFNLNIKNGQNLYLAFLNTSVRSSTIDSCKKLYLNISDHFNTENTGDFSISNSKILKLAFDFHDQEGNHDYYFKKDSISAVIFDNGIKTTPSTYFFEFDSHTITFDNCFIDSLLFNFRAPGTTLKFINCSFGSSASLEKLQVDRVSLNTTNNITEPLKVGFANDSILGYISFMNEDITKVQVNWTEKVWVYFDDIKSNEFVTRLFQNLLEKYRIEQRTETYKKLDIMNHYYTENAFVWSWDKNWWNHGYDKNRVFYWTALILFIFTISNFIFWRNMQKVYVLFPNSVRISMKPADFLKSFFSAFLYSSFIFFSLTIKLNKLKLSANTGFIAWFLFQYIVGLFCFLFIVKAILKW